jgi:hypothetical protein
LTPLAARCSNVSDGTPPFLAICTGVYWTPILFDLLQIAGGASMHGVACAARDGCMCVARAACIVYVILPIAPSSRQGARSGQQAARAGGSRLLCISPAAPGRRNWRLGGYDGGARWMSVSLPHLLQPNAFYWRYRSARARLSVPKRQPDAGAW